MPSQHSISCRSCREKKIRCNKVLPRCNKCEASGAECIYLGRRARAKRPRRPVTLTEDTLTSILNRLDRLEQYHNISRSQSPGATSDGRMSEHGEESDDECPTAQSATSLSHLVTEATNVARAILHQPAPSVDSAREVQNQSVLDTLETVAADINGFKMKDDISATDGTSTAEVKLSKEQAIRWVKEYFRSYFPISAVPAMLDQQFLLLIPELMDSPHVGLSNAALICYYGVVFQGMILDVGAKGGEERKRYFTWLYRTTLALVEKWQAEVKSTMIDFGAAYLVSWMARELLDYNLAWQFFCRACKIASEIGFFNVDDGSKTNTDDEQTKDLKRHVFWHLLQTDCLFRQHYGKPAVIRPGSWNVVFPETLMATAANSAIRIDQIVFIVGVRLGLVVLKSFDIDPSQQQSTIETLGDEIQTILKDWQIEERFQTASKPLDKWLYADLLFNSYTTTTLLYRMDPTLPIPERSVTAARASINLMRVISQTYPHHSHWSMEFVSYYPFVSFFTLFYNILSARSVEDLDLMLWLGNALSQWKKDREELAPLDAVARALNKVAEYVLRTSSGEPTPVQEWASGVGEIDFGEFLAAPMEYARGLETGIWRTDPHADWWDA